MHLWDVTHPYYFSGSYTEEHESWTEFLDAMGDADNDMNLVIRFDWREGEDWDVPNGESRLVLGYAHQRKGRMGEHIINVTRAQEPAIRVWLEKKLAYLLKNWSPLHTPADPSSP